MDDATCSPPQAYSVVGQIVLFFQFPGSAQRATIFTLIDPLCALLYHPFSCSDYFEQGARIVDVILLRYSVLSCVRASAPVPYNLIRPLIFPILRVTGCQVLSF